MNLFILLSFIGLINYSTTHVHEKKYLDHVKRSHQVRDHTTEKPPVNPSQTLSEYDGLNLVFNNEAKIIGFANVTQNVAYLNKGTLFLVDSKTGVILISNDSEKVTIISDNPDAKGDIIEVLSKLMDKYINKDEEIPGNSTEFKADDEKALAILDEVCFHLGHPQDPTEDRSQYRTFKRLNAISKKLSDQLNGPLHNIITGKFPAHPLKQNTNRFGTIMCGLEKLFTKAQGGLKAILEQGVKFEIDPLFNGKNGAEVFTYIMRTVGQKCEIGKVWPNLYSNPSELFKIIQELGGGEKKNGVDESFAVMQHVWEALNGRLSVTDLYKYLTKASSEENWSNSDGSNNEDIIMNMKNILDQQSRKYDKTGLMSPIMVFFTNYTGNSLIMHNINVSDIVQKWHKRDIAGGLKWVVDTSTSIFNPKLYSDLFFNSFTAFLNSSSDPNALKRLMPGAQTDQFTKNATLLDNINKIYDVDKKLKNGTDANSVMKEIPVFSEFSKTLGKDMNFSKMLKGSTLSEYVNRGNKFWSDAFKTAWEGTKGMFTEPGKFFQQIFIDPFKGLFNWGGGNPSLLSDKNSTKAATLPPTKDDVDAGGILKLIEGDSSTSATTTTTEEPCKTTTTSPPKSERSHHHMKHHFAAGNQNQHHENKLKHSHKNEVSENRNKKRNLEKKHDSKSSHHEHKMEKKHHEN